MEKWALELLQCPITKEPLQLADESTVAAIHSQLQSGTLKNRLGRTVSDIFESGLVNASGTWLYPMKQQIPTLIAEEAIPLQQVAHGR